jgi:hypothetical protein
MPSYHWRETAVILIYSIGGPFSLMRMSCQGRCSCTPSRGLPLEPTTGYCFVSVVPEAKGHWTRGGYQYSSGRSLEKP